MGVQITYEIDGRKVPPAEFFSGIKGKVRDMAVREITARVERVRCHEHGTTATVSNIKETADGFAFEVSGCCDALVQRAQRSATR